MINHTGHVTTQMKHIHDASILLKRASNRGAPSWIQPVYICLHNVGTLLQMLKGVTKPGVHARHTCHWSNNPCTDEGQEA